MNIESGHFRLNEAQKTIDKINHDSTLMNALRSKDYDRALYILEQVFAYIGLPIEYKMEAETMNVRVSYINGSPDMYFFANFFTTRMYRLSRF